MLCFNDRRMQAIFQIRHTFNRIRYLELPRERKQFRDRGVRYNRVRVKLQNNLYYYMVESEILKNTQ
jgi:hypothetical protein